jgi:OmpA-OmpF porin, OOP family
MKNLSIQTMAIKTMTIKIVSKKIFLASVLSAFTLPALADNFYVFGDLGQGKMEVDADSNSTISKTGTAFSFGAGFGINQFVAVEIAYRDLGDITDRGIEFDEVDYYKYVDTYQTTALQASVVGKLPISDVVNLYGRLGLATIDSDYESKAFYDDGFNPTPYSDTKSKTKALFGLGASFDISPQLALRAEYNQYAKWDDLKLSALTLGAAYSF